MAKHVQGSAVANATSYKLYNTGTGAELMTQGSGGDIDFDLSTLSLAAGTYSLAVKAFDSTGTYATSDFSNTVSYTVEGGEEPGTLEVRYQGGISSGATWSQARGP